MVDEFVGAATNDPQFPRLIFIHQGTVEQGEQHFAGIGHPVAVVADPEAMLYRAFAIERGGLRAMFGLRAWIRGIQAFLKGHFIGRKVGDPWTLPTLIAVDDGRIVWEHRGVHAGDHPNIGNVPRAATV